MGVGSSAGATTDNPLFSIVVNNDASGLRNWANSLTNEDVQVEIARLLEGQEDVRLSGKRRSIEEGSKISEYEFNPMGMTLLGLSVRLQHYEIMHELLVLSTKSNDPSKTANLFINQTDLRGNTASDFASKIFNPKDPTDPANRFLNTLVIRCGADFIVQEDSHYLLSNDLMFLLCGLAVIVGYILCWKWAEILEKTGIANYWNLNLQCDGLYGITLKPIFLTFLDAASLRVLQYFSSNKRYTWFCSKVTSLCDVYKLEDTGDLVESALDTLERKGEKAAELLEQRTKGESPEEYREEPQAQGLFVACFGPTLSDYAALPNPCYDPVEYKRRVTTRNNFKIDAQTYDETTGRLGPEMRNNRKLTFVYLQVIKFLFSVVFSFVRADYRDDTLTSYCNFYGLIINADTPTMIFTLLAPIKMDLEVLHYLEDLKGWSGFWDLLEKIFFYFWYRAQDLLDVQKFGFWSVLFAIPFLIMVPPVYSHFIVAGVLYFWIGVIFLLFVSFCWYAKGLFFKIMHLFDGCLDVWFIFYCCVEVLCRFGFVVYCQVLYNAISVLYLGKLQDRLQDSSVYYYALWWTWHLTMNPQCFIKFPHFQELLVYISAF